MVILRRRKDVVFLLYLFICLFVCLFVCLYVCVLDYSKSYERSFMNFSSGGGVAEGPVD